VEAVSKERYHTDLTGPPGLRLPSFRGGILS
jgi:hypothetical protein